MMRENKERRHIDRIEYEADSVVVVCDTQEKIRVRVENVSPLGMGAYLETDRSDLLGKDIIIVTDTLIMYAEVVRYERREENTYYIGINARKFTPDVLEYLFSRIGIDEQDS